MYGYRCTIIGIIKLCMVISELTTTKKAEFLVIPIMLDTVHACLGIRRYIPGHSDNTLTKESACSAPGKSAIK